MATRYGRQLIAVAISVGLLGAPGFSAPAPSTQLGIVVFADHARVGTGPISVGSTVFGGDNVSTESTGTLQIRAGAARLLLANASAATLTREDEARFWYGSAVAHSLAWARGADTNEPAGDRY